MDKTVLTHSATLQPVRMVQSPHPYLASVAQTFPYASRTVVLSNVPQLSAMMVPLLRCLKMVAAQTLPYASLPVMLTNAKQNVEEYIHVEEQCIHHTL